jgi:hypothetical protein
MGEIEETKIYKFVEELRELLGKYNATIKSNVVAKQDFDIATGTGTMHMYANLEFEVDGDVAVLRSPYQPVQNVEIDSNNICNNETISFLVYDK